MPLTRPPNSSAIQSSERVPAMAHVPAEAHVVVIGRHALPVVLALLRHGCACVRSLRDIVAFDHVTQRVMLASQPVLAMAA